MLGIVRRVSRRTARRTTRRTIRRSLLLGTGIAATAAVGFLLNRRHQNSAADELPTLQTSTPDDELLPPADSPPAV